MIGNAWFGGKKEKTEVTFSACLVNAQMSEEGENALGDAFAEASGIGATNGKASGSEKQSEDHAQNSSEASNSGVQIESSLVVAPGTQNSEFDLTAIDQIEVLEERGELDILIADAWNFERLTGQGTVRDLREVLTEEQLAKWQEQIYYIDLAVLKEEQQKMREDTNYFGPTVSQEDAIASEQVGTFALPDPSKMKEPTPVGIRITDASLVQKENWYGSTEAILGMAAESKRSDLAYEFLEFLYEEET